MLYGLYLSAAGLQVQERRQDTIANNLANASTNGFKRDLAIIQSRANPTQEDPTLLQYKVPVLQNQGGGVTLQSAGVDLSQGSFHKTNSPNDLALDGRGFFALKGDNGQTVLTRDGSFAINDQGSLVHLASGRAVLGGDGQPIQLDPNQDITVTQTGQVTQATGNAQQLKIVDVPDSRNLIKMGKNLLTVSDPKNLAPVSSTTSVLQGNVEMSGVDPMVELVNMMSNQRIFDANAKMINLQDTSLQSLNTIGRVA